MAALPYIQLYVADYLADTAHLSVTASGAYLHLIMNYWQTGKPLKNCDKRLSSIAKCFNGEWELVKDDVKEFFTEIDGMLHHGRIDSDLQRVSGRGSDDPELSGDWKGYVYFISNEVKDKVKIGYSKNPWARIKDLQTTSSEKLLLVATVKTTDASEKKLHAELAEYLIHGEWFCICPLISGLINSIKTKEITNVVDSIDYCRNYGITTVDTTKDTDTDTDKSKEVKKRSQKKVNTEKTLNEFLDDCKTSGEKVIREDDPIFEWAKTVSLPGEMLHLGWVEFKNLQASDKKQADWRATFRNYVKKGYLKVWEINRDGEYYLTLLGKQLDRELNGVT